MFARGLRSQSTCARASRPVDAGPQKNNKPCMSEIGTCRGKLCTQHLFKCALGLELDMNIWWALALSATSRTLYKEGESPRTQSLTQESKHSHCASETTLPKTDNPRRRQHPTPRDWAEGTKP